MNLQLNLPVTNSHIYSVTFHWINFNLILKLSCQLSFKFLICQLPVTMPLASAIGARSVLVKVSTVFLRTPAKRTFAGAYRHQRRHPHVPTGLHGSTIHINKGGGLLLDQYMVAGFHFAAVRRRLCVSGSYLPQKVLRSLWLGREAKR